MTDSENCDMKDFDEELHKLDKKEKLFVVWRAFTLTECCVVGKIVTMDPYDGIRTSLDHHRGVLKDRLSIRFQQHHISPNNEILNPGSDHCDKCLSIYKWAVMIV